MNRMSDQNNNASSQAKSWWISSTLLLRLGGGVLLGFIVSSFLIVLDRAGVGVPLLGAIIGGRVELFNLLFFYMFYDFLGSTDLAYVLAKLVCSTIWALAGALLLSGKRKPKRIAIIFLVLCMIV